MILLWAWSATAPAAAACGVCDDVGRAQRTAAEWMRANAANAGLLEEVRLAIGAGSLAPRHEPTGTVLRARRHRDGYVRWTLAASGEGTAVTGRQAVPPRAADTRSR